MSEKITPVARILAALSHKGHRIVKGATSDAPIIRKHGSRRIR